jgi:diacylglycerol kinase family enzyme
MVSSTKRLLIAVGNGACVGGGFYLTPEAKVDDGLLDVCAIDDLSVMKILGIMPKVMRGKHRGNPGVSFFQGRHITVTGDSGYYVHADGEIIGRGVRRVSIGLRERALNVITG